MLSVIIPAFNEGSSVGEVVRALQEVLRSSKLLPYEIIVVDDGSSDNTAQSAREAGAIVCAHLQNLGYGRSVKTGVSAASHDLVAITDADGTYPLEALPKLVDEYHKGYHMVVGARQGIHYRESWIKMPLRRILKFLVEFACGKRIPDVNSGLRVFSKKEVMRFFPQLSNSFSFTTSVTLAYLLNGKFIKYFPISYNKRIGRTKVHLFWDALRTLQYIVQAILFYNPIKIFLLLMIGALSLGFVSLLLDILGPFSQGSLVCAIGVLVAVVLFGLGCVSDIIRQHMSNSRTSSE